jgi:transposase-like protein
LVSSQDEGTNMTVKSSNTKKPAAQVVKDILRVTRRHFSAEDEIWIVLDGLRGEDSIAELCRKEGIAQSLYYAYQREPKFPQKWAPKNASVAAGGAGDQP